MPATDAPDTTRDERARSGPRVTGPSPPPRRRSALAMALLVTAGCVLVAGCAGQEQSGPPSGRVSTWVSGAGGGVAIGTLEVDSRNIAFALSKHDPPAAIKTVCALITNDAQTDIGNLPTPDNQLTNDLNDAYEDASAVGDDCYRGASGDVVLLRRSAAERAKLVPLLTTAVDRIVAVTGHTPSTSTTQPPPGGDPFGN
ncbi:MAG: hypothetical protein ACLQPH_03495 [Acidimicrobiales bacterium]